MSGTTLKDVIVPEIFEPYVARKSLELSALYQSGVIENNSEFDKLAGEAAPIHTMPFFEDLTGDADDVVEGVKLEAEKIKSNTDVCATIRRAKMWSSTDLAASLAGTDPMLAIANNVGGFWARNMQKELISTLKGVFASEKMKDHILDISAGSGKAANISASAFIDGLELLGDAQASLGIVVMHSATKAYLKKQNLITTERDSTDVEFEVYQGRRVIVDDGCPVSSGVYTTYIFGQGAIAFGLGSPVGEVRTEVDREKQMGSGVDFLINRRTFILHPRGIKWTNKKREHVETVSRTELEDATNWEPVYESKAIRLVAIKHKLG